MIKTVYVTVEALIKLFNEDYGMRLPKNTRFILTSEINKEKEQSYIADLQSQLAITEKALELCERHHIGFEESTVKEQVDWRETRIKENIEYFKTKAKEMLKNE